MATSERIKSSTRLIKSEATSQLGMVATNSPLATEAGLRMLKSGGNAVDAAVAAAFAIAVVEPTSNGIGGGGYLVYEVSGQGGVLGFPMRGPLAANEDMYKLTGESSVGSFGWPGVVGDDNIEGSRSIATPGAVAGLCLAQERLGKLSLSEVMLPAIELARWGFKTNWYYSYSFGQQFGKLFKYAELRRVFAPGDAMPSTEMLSPSVIVQENLADALEVISKEGAKAFYRGDLTREIVKGIKAEGGILTEEDFANYEVQIAKGGLEFRYRGNTIRVPPGANAGTTTAMTLRLLDGYNIASLGHNSEEMLHLYISCAQLAYADRFAYLADPTFVPSPYKGLLNHEYINGRRGLIRENSQQFEQGDPWAYEASRPDHVLPSSRPAWDTGTTHLCVIDGNGNAVSLTNTLMSGFGSGVIPKGTGIVMNNGMMWFDPVPGRVNSIAPGKYPLNNMTPALVLGEQGVKVAVGASGGRMITNCVTQLVSKIIDFEMGPQEAIDSPRVDCSKPEVGIDPRIHESIQSALAAKGHVLKPINKSLLEEGFSSFASPLAIVRSPEGTLKAGVDTFKLAHAEGM